MERALIPAMIGPMSMRENEFEPRLGSSPPDRVPKLKGVRSLVRQAKRQPRSASPKPASPSFRAHFAKGTTARGPRPSGLSRRVVVKMRFAANGGGRAAPLRTHVKYLQREGTQPERVVEPAVKEPEDPTRAVDYLTRGESDGTAHRAFYDRASDLVDGKAVTSAWADDPRHFRMIVSAEDGAALGDLKPFIREVMAGLEGKLGTRLEWVAIDHHDTDNPHTHVLIRGRRPDGQDLFIPSRMVSSGIREHAQEIVTRVLGPRVGVDLAKERFREIDALALTRLDRELIADGRAGALMPGRADLIARLQRLEGLGLAERGTDGWRLAHDIPRRLNRMAEHADVLRAVEAAQPGREPRLILEADRAAPVTGELVHLGPVDEISDRFLAVIETGAGELRYARFERPQDLAILAGAEPGAVVTFEANQPTIRPSDEAVARVAARNGGLYSADIHSALEAGIDRRLVAANIRRLEVMRRMGLVERNARGEFVVGHDHVGTALKFEERLVRRTPFRVQVASYWTLGDQTHAFGPTYLDQLLAGKAAAPAGEGKFALDVEQAVQSRRLFLIEQGWLGRDDVGPSRQALDELRKVQLLRHAQALAAELKLPVLTHEARYVSGVYARRLDLSQGRMALVIGERQAHLVPWRPALERFIGQRVEGVLRDQALSWSLSRGHGLAIG